MSKDAVHLEMENTTRSKMKELEEGYISKAYNTKDKNNDKHITMWVVHAKKMNTAQTNRQAKQIKEFDDIAHKIN